MLVGRKGISAALILWAAAAGIAQAQSVNQATADAVAKSLRGSRSLSGYRIEVETNDGVATLSGVVATAAHKKEAVTRARRAAGVTSVVDKLVVAGADRVLPAQYQVAHGFGHGGAPADDIIYDGAPTVGGMAGGPAAGAGAAAGGPAMAADGGPLPEGPAVMEGPQRMNVPAYPNYAWPSYAPYPNFSAVGYPTIYPWQAWPNIGPFYPYPEPPLDYRAVTAQYHDGVWHVKFRKHYTRPFLVPWPVAGIFNRAY
jgi:hypothetical protein